MIRSAVLVSGKGTKLQSLLDSVFFGEIPELQLVAVISSDANAYALKRARNAGIETVVVEPAMFPNDTSYDMAIRNKLKDMDIELVINAGFSPGVARALERVGIGVGRDDGDELQLRDLAEEHGIEQALQFCSLAGNQNSTADHKQFTPSPAAGRLWRGYYPPAG